MTRSTAATVCDGQFVRDVVNRVADQPYARRAVLFDGGASVGVLLTEAEFDRLVLLAMEGLRARGLVGTGAEK